MEIKTIPNHSVDPLWGKLKSYFEGVAKYTHGRFTANDIRERLKNKPFQHLWVAHEGEDIKGFVITEFCSYPQMKVLVMHFTGGIEIETWKQPMLKQLQDFARMNGCEAIESFGRSGWVKVFKEDGYEALSVFYELPVGE